MVGWTDKPNVALSCLCFWMQPLAVGGVTVVVHNSKKTRFVRTYFSDDTEVSSCVGISTALDIESALAD